MKTIIFIGALLMSLNLQAQNAIIEAFSKSYQLEYAGDYRGGVDAMKKVYDAKSYEQNLRLGWLSYMGGQHTEAVAYYEKATALMPFSIEAKLGYVLPLAALSNWSSVLKQYEEIIKIEPKNAVANYRSGLIYYEKRDYAKAATYFERLVNLYPFEYDYVIMYAWSNYQLGKMNEAKVLFNKALMNRPTDASAIEGLTLIK